VLTNLPLVVPRLRVAPPAIRNDAGLVAELAESYGMRLDPWQLDVLEAGLGVRADGSWAARTLGLNLPRQNGKSVLALVRVLAGALLFGEKSIVVSAHEQRTVRLLFQGMTAYFENYHDLRRRVKSVIHALGREEILLMDGTRIGFPSRTRSNLRGFSVDLIIVDEAQLLQDVQWEAALPALSARPNSVAWHLGTAPQFTTDAQVFGRLRESALTGAADLAWVEYGAEPGSSLDDRDQWRQANPGRVSMAAVESERLELSAGGFARERLNLWPTEQSERVVDPAVWAGLVAAGPGGGVAPTALGVDRGMDGVAVVAACWCVGDGRHVEVVHQQTGVDVSAVAEWLIGKAGRRIPVVIDSGGTAAAMLPALAAARVKVVQVGAGDVARAAAGFLDDVAEGRLSHTGQPDLDGAVAAAKRRPIGTAGAFGWERKTGANQAPLIAVSLARFGAVAAAVRPRTGRATFV